MSCCKLFFLDWLHISWKIFVFVVFHFWVEEFCVCFLPLFLYKIFVVFQFYKKGKKNCTQKKTKKNIVVLTWPILSQKASKTILSEQEERKSKHKDPKKGGTLDGRGRGDVAAEAEAR